MGNFTVGVVPRDGIIPLEAEQALDSGNPSAYARILEENDILRGNDITRFTREYREPYMLLDENTFVAVIPGLPEEHNPLPLMEQQLDESGSTELYPRILSENTVWRNVTFTGVRTIEEDYYYILCDNSFVAVIPKDGRIKSEEEQLLESGFPSQYNKILDENIIWRGVGVAGNLLIRIAFFYKHLRIKEYPDYL